jgi:DNA-binding transcriptional ArsR family regulator
MDLFGLILNQMVNLQAEQLDLLFYALSDSTRRQILALVGQKAHTITELAKPFKMSLAAVSKHIKILEGAKLLVRKRQGRIHSCTLDASQLKTAEACIKFYTQFWNQRLDMLTQTLEVSNGKRK